ncbi:toll/interleukin-1 receptor domain-containing protein, partial [Frankia sp. AiPa1]|uniref:toll/interleukin-1 receptor domain-containing protein n=1 Tax=Frankia sp. AiPa1 TaxID=573492 RepID=UPI00202B83F1
MIDGGDAGVGAGTSEGWHFFISYTNEDKAWAVWIAWQLEEAGYRVLIQAWDFVAGNNLHIRMAEGMQHAERTIAVLSKHYLDSIYGQTEWKAAHGRDPLGFQRQLIPIRVEDCRRPGSFAPIISIDLFDLEQDQAQAHLLSHVRSARIGRAKPSTAPAFPVKRVQPTSEPTFPAEQLGPAAPHAGPNEPRTPEKTYAERLPSLGRDNPDGPSDLHHLAYSLKEKGDFQAARPLFEETLERRRRTLGPDHPDTLHTAHELGVALEELGDPQAARSLLEETLERRRGTLGPEDPETLRTAHELADALAWLGDHQAARPLLEETLECRRGTLGPEDPETLRTAHELADALAW